MFPKPFLASVLERTDLVELVGASVKLKRSGSEWRGYCPFHKEKTASFFVSPTKQFFHCFGCGAHGDAFSWLMDHDRLEFREAVEMLAQRAGLAVPADAAPARERGNGDEQQRLLGLLERAAGLYRTWLAKHPGRKAARTYLLERGVSAEMVERFGLGFAPGGNALLRALREGGATVAALLAAGLVAEKDGRTYDRLRGRLVFPIRDQRGRVVGFSGRALGDTQPKYLNTPETAVFHKGHELYGLPEVLQANRRPERLAVVEGPLDVIALHQAGLPWAVATQGTATTKTQLTRLLRLTPEVVFCFDGDPAGRAAVWKAVQLALPHVGGGSTVRFLLLPEGHDPDSLVRAHGAEALLTRLADARLLSDALFDHLTAKHDPASAEGAAALDAAARPLLATMPAGAYRTRLEQRLAHLTGAPVITTSAPRQPRPRRGRASPTPALTPARTALALLLAFPELADHARELPANWRAGDSGAVALIDEVLALTAVIPDLPTELLLERWHGAPEAATVARLADLGQRLDMTATDLPGALSRALAALAPPDRASAADAAETAT